MEAARANNFWRLNGLLERFGYTVQDAGKFAASHGNTAALNFLLPMIFDYEDSENDGMDDETFAVMETMATSAARYGHLEVVRMGLPEFGEFDPLCRVAWRVLDIAAGRGHLDIVEFAHDTTAGGDYSEPEDISSEALFLAVRGRHTAVVNFLLPLSENVWDLRRALELAIATGLLTVVTPICEAYLENNSESMDDLFVELGTCTV